MKKNNEFIGIDEKFVPENEKFVNEDCEKEYNSRQNFSKLYFKLIIGVTILSFIFIIGSAILQLITIKSTF